MRRDDLLLVAIRRIAKCRIPYAVLNQVNFQSTVFSSDYYHNQAKHKPRITSVFGGFEGYTLNRLRIIFSAR
jgi:hypothetical protein